MKYIRNWPLQPFSQDYWPSVLILYISGGTYSLKSTANDRFFEKLFMAISYLLSELLPEICWEENRRRNTFRILFWCLAWGSNPGFSSNKPMHYLLDHGDFIWNIDLNNGVYCDLRNSSACLTTVLSYLRLKFSKKSYSKSTYIVIGSEVLGFTSKVNKKKHS